MIKRGLSPHVAQKRKTIGLTAPTISEGRKKKNKNRRRIGCRERTLAEPESAAFVFTFSPLSTKRALTAGHGLSRDSLATNGSAA